MGFICWSKVLKDSLFLPMGCSNSKQVVANGAPAPTVVDNRLPLTEAEVKEIRTVWNLVKRKFEETAMENLIRFFRINPIFQQMFPHLQDSLCNEQDMRTDMTFQVHAIAVFSVYDDVIENLPRDLDTIYAILGDVVRSHSKMDGFHNQFFKFMEDPFIDSLRDKFWGDFHEREEELFRKLFSWMTDIMTSECNNL